VVFLLDTSDSMLNALPGKEQTRLDEAKAALAQVVRGMSRETRVQMWMFNTRLNPLAIAGGRPGTFIPIGGPGLRKRLIEKIAGIRTAGGTNLYQAIIRTLDIFAVPADQPLYRSGQRFPVLVIISDGEDGGKTGHTLDAVLAAKRRFPLVTINTIGFHVSGQEQWFSDLCRIATRASGCAKAGNQAQLKSILESFYRWKAGANR
jgi:Mg-chelatase subunit ChlD